MSENWHDAIQRYMSGSTTREESEGPQEALKDDAEIRLLYLDYLNLELALEAKAESIGEVAEMVPITDFPSAAKSRPRQIRRRLAAARVSPSRPPRLITNHEPGI
jgi:hypothetical protein